MTAPAGRPDPTVVVRATAALGLLPNRPSAGGR
jgi:hypothetical protein